MLGLTNEQIRSSLVPDSCYEFLQQPWELRNGRCIVKGKNHTFEPDAFGGPFTKYTALFDTRELFDGLRESFLFRAGGHRLERLGAAISGYAPRDTSVDSEALQIVQSYLIDFRDVFVASTEFIDPRRVSVILPGLCWLTACVMKAVTSSSVQTNYCSCVS
jgi:hypothetical protein